MVRLSSLIGKHVVTADTGRRLGKVTDVLIDARRMQIVALIVSVGWLAGQRVLPSPRVQRLGYDVVLAATPTLVARDEWDHGGEPLARRADLAGKPVLTREGTRMGVLTDLVVDPETTEIEEVEIGHQLEGRLTRWSRVPAPAVSIGADAVVVTDVGEPGR
jgi:sporulation protein YlmC with PRC-barrel domain